MSNCDRIIRSLEEHSSRLNKEAIIEAEAEAGNAELFEGFNLALDNLISFGVKKVPTHSGPDGQGLPWIAFKQLCESLRKRELTGHDARDAIELALSVSTQSQWNDWYRRILIKDLRCGISEPTVNKVLKGRFSHIAKIPVFECMLAHDGAKHEKKIKGKKLLEFKLDGVRCLTVIDMDSRTVTQYTRNGQVLENFKHITNALQANIDDYERSYVIDGEVVSSSFQELMTQVKRKSDVQAQDARLRAFDIIPLSEFKAGKSVMGQKRRSKFLQSLKPLLNKIESIDIIEQIEVDLDTAVGEMQFTEFNRRALAEKYEGIMIKEPDAKYECKRSTSWLKMKPFIEVSLTVVGIEEGTGKNQGRLGAFVCAGRDDGKDITVNVGSGFTDEQRAEYWNSRDSILGQIVEVRADVITQNQDGTYSLRFPRFLRFRGFKSGEKI